MEEFKLELDRSDENTVYYELHPADPGETYGSDCACWVNLPPLCRL